MDFSCPECGENMVLMFTEKGWRTWSETQGRLAVKLRDHYYCCSCGHKHTEHRINGDRELIEFHDNLIKGS